jgi:hypothetical protein
LGKGHGEVQKTMRKEEGTYRLDRVFIRDSTQGSKKAASVQQKGEKGWVKPHVTHLLQNMEVPAEIYPGGSLVPVFFRKATPSLQLTRGTCTRQFNIQEAQLPPGASHAELKRRVTGEQRADLMEAD